MKRAQILNATFDPLTLTQTADTAFQMLDTRQRGWLATVNVSILMMMRSNNRLQGFVDRAALVVADGQPLVWCSRWLGQCLPERVTGVDLVDVLCQRAAAEGKKVFLLGSRHDTVETLASRLRARHPNLQIEFADGYFGRDESEARVALINASGADILFVGMGVPLQEYFLEEHWDRLNVGLALAVGGSFEVLAGERLRAPRWVQRVGMEWLFRLVQEPRRLFARYVVTNTQFVWFLLDALRKKNCEEIVRKS
jgi:N-acetylglucosaminyldiphosphoundecaprenol N-acetyl-beta-D-mannosaminyltransferase